jgi:hypothetical protein
MRTRNLKTSFLPKMRAFKLGIGNRKRRYRDAREFEKRCFNGQLGLHWDWMTDVHWAGLGENNVDRQAYGTFLPISNQAIGCCQVPV